MGIVQLKLKVMVAEYLPNEILLTRDIAVGSKQSFPQNYSSCCLILFLSFNRPSVSGYIFCKLLVRVVHTHCPPPLVLFFKRVKKQHSIASKNYL